jgi:DNA repair exonuclease SbcCD ATPase subunit
MRWAPTRNAPPASAEHLAANLATEEAAADALAAEQEEIRRALTDLVAEPDRFVEAQDRLREIEALLPSKRRTVDAIRQAIPLAEERERIGRIAAEIDEQARQTEKLKRNLEARYTKAATAYAEVCRDIKADADRWRSLRMSADTTKPRVPVNHFNAEMALRYDKFASEHSGLKSLIDDVIVRAWDGTVIFN